jgi:hypothetical protein
LKALGKAQHVRHWKMKNSSPSSLPTLIYQLIPNSSFFF